MKNLIITISLSLSLLASCCAIYAANLSSPSYNQESFSSTDDNADKFLGTVNLCDPEGTICYVSDAYKDTNNGRIYFYTIGNIVLSYKIYAQKSNDSRWDYMIRYEDRWLYFSL